MESAQINQNYQVIEINSKLFCNYSLIKNTEKVGLTYEKALFVIRLVLVRREFIKQIAIVSKYFKILQRISWQYQLIQYLIKDAIKRREQNPDKNNNNNIMNSRNLEISQNERQSILLSLDLLCFHIKYFLNRCFKITSTPVTRKVIPTPKRQLNLDDKIEKIDDKKMLRMNRTYMMSKVSFYAFTFFFM